MLPIVCFLLNRGKLNSFSFHVAQEKWSTCFISHITRQIFWFCHNTTQRTVLKRQCLSKLCICFNYVKAIERSSKTLSNLGFYLPMFKPTLELQQKINNVHWFSKLSFHIPFVVKNFSAMKFSVLQFPSMLIYCHVCTLLLNGRLFV